MYLFLCCLRKTKSRASDVSHVRCCSRSIEVAAVELGDVADCVADGTSTDGAALHGAEEDELDDHEESKECTVNRECGGAFNIGNIIGVS